MRCSQMIKKSFLRFDDFKFMVRGVVGILYKRPVKIDPIKMKNVKYYTYA